MADESESAHGLELPQVFQAELMEQCNAATIAFAELRTFASRPPPMDMEERIFWSRRIWSRVQAVLAAQAAINLILWPSPDRNRGEDACSKSRQRGWSVRAALEIRDDKPTVGGFVFRAIERFDELLDDIQGGANHDRRLGWLVIADTPEVERRAADKALRFYGVNSKLVRVGEEECNLLEVVRWVENLMDFIKYSGHFVDTLQDELAQ